MTLRPTNIHLMLSNKSMLAMKQIHESSRVYHLASYHLPSLRNSIISKCSADSLVQRGVNTWPPTENKRSNAAVKLVISYHEWQIILRQ